MSQGLLNFARTCFCDRAFRQKVLIAGIQQEAVTGSVSFTPIPKLSGDEVGLFALNYLDCTTVPVTSYEVQFLVTVDFQQNLLVGRQALTIYCERQYPAGFVFSDPVLNHTFACLHQAGVDFLQYLNNSYHNQLQHEFTPTVL